MVQDIIETKSFKEPKETIQWSTPKYRQNLSFKSKAFDFINLPKILRSKEVCDNLPSNFDISDILTVVYNFNPSIRSTFFNYKQFALHLNFDEFLKDLNSIRSCCNNRFRGQHGHYAFPQTFSVGGVSWTLDPSNEAVNSKTKHANNKLAVWYSYLQQLHIDEKTSNYRCQNKNHENLLFFTVIIFSSPGLGL